MATATKGSRPTTGRDSTGVHQPVSLTVGTGPTSGWKNTRGWRRRSTTSAASASIRSLARLGPFGRCRELLSTSSTAWWGPSSSSPATPGGACCRVLDSSSGLRDRGPGGLAGQGGGASFDAVPLQRWQVRPFHEDEDESFLRGRKGRGLRGLGDGHGGGDFRGRWRGQDQGRPSVPGRHRGDLGPGTADHGTQEALSLVHNARERMRRPAPSVSAMPARLGETFLTGHLKNGTALCPDFNTGECRQDPCSREHMCAMLQQTGRACGGRHPASECRAKRRMTEAKLRELGLPVPADPAEVGATRPAGTPSEAPAQKRRRVYCQSPRPDLCPPDRLPRSFGRRQQPTRWWPSRMRRSARSPLRWTPGAQQSQLRSRAISWRSRSAWA